MYTQIPVTIASGAALSNIIDIKQFHIAAIYMPAAWDAAAITFLGGAADPAATYDTTPAQSGAMQSLYDDTGAEISVTAAASRTIGITTAAKASAIMPLRFLQLRSGTVGTPVNQTATRTILLLVKSY